MTRSAFWRVRNALRGRRRRVRGLALTLRLRAAGVHVGPGLEAEPGVRFRYAPGPHWRIGSNVYLGYGLVFDSPGLMEIGDRCRINHYTTISSIESVTIGDDTLIAECCSVRDANHDFEGELLRAITAPIRIGRSVWIARGCAVLAGVTIGDRAVIGANAVVTRDVPASSVAVGIPATSRPRAGSGPEASRHPTG